METITLNRETAKHCLDALLNAILHEGQLDPNWHHDAWKAVNELNSVLGCKAVADRIAKRTAIEDEAE